GGDELGRQECAAECDHGAIYKTSTADNHAKVAYRNVGGQHCGHNWQGIAKSHGASGTRGRICQTSRLHMNRVGVRDRGRRFVNSDSVNCAYSRIAVRYPIYEPLHCGCATRAIHSGPETKRIAEVDLDGCWDYQHR